MAAAREQAEERRLQRLRLKVERRDVPVEVVDRDERQPARPRDRLRRAEPDEQRADQAGPLRHGDPVDVVEGDAGLAERLTDHRRHELEMPPRRNLRNHSAVARMEVGLGRDDVRANLACVGDDRGSGLVAARLESEDRPRSRATGSFHMISASSRLSV